MPGGKAYESIYSKLETASKPFSLVLQILFFFIPNGEFSLAMTSQGSPAAVHVGHSMAISLYDLFKLKSSIIVRQAFKAEAPCAAVSSHCQRKCRGQNMLQQIQIKFASALGDNFPFSKVPKGCGVILCTIAAHHHQSACPLLASKPLLCFPL